MLKKYLSGSIVAFVMLSSSHSVATWKWDYTCQGHSPCFVEEEANVSSQDKLISTQQKLDLVDDQLHTLEAKTPTIDLQISHELEYQQGIIEKQNSNLETLRNLLFDERLRVAELSQENDLLLTVTTAEDKQEQSFDSEKNDLEAQVQDVKQERTSLEKQVATLQERIDEKREDFFDEKQSKGIIIINPTSPPSMNKDPDIIKTSSRDTTPPETECDLLTALDQQFEPPTMAELTKYPPSLQRLIAMGNPTCGYDCEESNSEMQQMRPLAIREAAYTISIQTAVKWRYRRITELMESVRGDLDEAYDFSPLLLYNSKLLPPVITKANASFKLENSMVAVSSDTTYRIIQDARIITKTPSWRDYIWKEFKAIDDVNKILLPETETEERVWKEAIIDGWQQGMLQAHRLYVINLNRLERDFNGMITYMLLEEQNIVSMPKLSEGRFAVKISENGKALDVDQKIFRITEKIDFQDVNSWNPSASTVN